MVRQRDKTAKKPDVENLNSAMEEVNLETTRRKDREKQRKSSAKAQNQSVFAIKSAASRKFNNENHKVVLIKYAKKMSAQEIINLCTEVGVPVEVRCHPMPNPQNHFFWGQVEMGSFDEAAQLIHTLRAKMATGEAELNMVDWAKEESIPKQQNRNGRRKDKSPPSDKHRVVCCHFREMKDQNQLRNLALRVAQPTGVKALDKAGKSGKFTGFIEMETHALALELFEQIKEEEKEVDVTWAKEGVLKVAESASVRKFKRSVQNWGGRKSVVLASSGALAESDIRQMLKSSKDEAVSSSIGIKVAAAAISGTFYHEIRFPTGEMALEFFRESFENPAAGVRVEVAGNAMETSTHFTAEQTEELVQQGELVVGVLRVSPANYNTAFVSDPAGGTDYVIATRALQNRALSGDKVAIKILPEDQWTRNKNGVQQRTAEVKAIVESKSIKRCAGCFSSMELTGINAADLLFVPMDSRLPRLVIAKSSLSADSLKQISEYLEKKIIYQVEIVEWEEGSMNARARLVDRIGDPEDLSNIIEATLINYGVDTADLEGADLVDELPGADWSMTPAEIARRRDFRAECVFSIDPATARDLDDALHVKQLRNGNVEVGVHIADVAFFVTPKGKIDKTASERCTSTYMPDRVVPMLPRRLCEDLCSLNPAVERYSFSVVFEMDQNGVTIGEPWYGRGVIQSCAKLSYEHAQAMLDNPDGTLDPENYPQIDCGFNLQDVRTAVLKLNQIALKLREKRFENGSIRIDQTKIGFTWDQESKTPNGFFAYVRKDAHKLIEEFMLLANCAVAEKIESAFPELAFLRCHPPPNDENCTKLKESMEPHGIHVNTDSSGAFAASIKKILEKHIAENGGNSVPFESALSIFSVKIMNLAKYFCAGKQEYYRHYALAMPLYTHFTSPIRRYADLVVHRQLAAAIGCEEAPSLTCEELATQAQDCNERKVQAKLAGEEGSQIYFWSMVKMITRDSSFIMDGVVIDLVEHGLEVLLYETGTNVRCYYGEMTILRYQAVTVEKEEQKTITSVQIAWASDGKRLGRDPVTNTPNKAREGACAGLERYSLFKTVKVSVTANSDPGRLIGQLLMPTF